MIYHGVQLAWCPRVLFCACRTFLAALFHVMQSRLLVASSTPNLYNRSTCLAPRRHQLSARIPNPVPARAASVDMSTGAQESDQTDIHQQSFINSRRALFPCDLGPAVASTTGDFCAHSDASCTMARTDAKARLSTLISRPWDRVATGVFQNSMRWFFEGLLTLYKCIQRSETGRAAVRSKEPTHQGSYQRPPWTRRLHMSPLGRYAYKLYYNALHSLSTHEILRRTLELHISDGTSTSVPKCRQQVLGNLAQ